MDKDGSLDLTHKVGQYRIQAPAPSSLTVTISERSEKRLIRKAEFEDDLKIGLRTGSPVHNWLTGRNTRAD
jgi:hypothetical protein